MNILTALGNIPNKIPKLCSIIPAKTYQKFTSLFRILIGVVDSQITVKPHDEWLVG